MNTGNTFRTFKIWTSSCTDKLMAKSPTHYSSHTYWLTWMQVLYKHVFVSASYATTGFLDQKREHPVRWKTYFCCYAAGNLMPYHSNIPHMGVSKNRGVPKWMVYMGVSENSGTPKSSIFIGFSSINHPFWGYPYFWKHPYVYNYIPTRWLNVTFLSIFVLWLDVT